MEMGSRGYFHRSPLDESLALGKDVQDIFVDEPSVQYKILKSKRCECDV
jgi:hypothetical protein